MQQFVEGFRASKECNGITLYLKESKPPQFTVQMTVNNHDRPGREQGWIWMLFEAGKKELGGLGNQSSAKLTARDVCMTVWEDVDPNHYKAPGGRVE